MRAGIYRSTELFHHEDVGDALLFVEFFRGDVAALFIKGADGGLGVDAHGGAAFAADGVFHGGEDGGADAFAAAGSEDGEPAYHVLTARIEVAAGGDGNSVEVAQDVAGVGVDMVELLRKALLLHEYGLADIFCLIGQRSKNTRSKFHLFFLVKYFYPLSNSHNRFIAALRMQNITKTFCNIPKDAPRDAECALVRFIA